MCRASSALPTIGTITPNAPTSSARAMNAYSPRGTRTMGTMPRPRHNANWFFSVSKPSPVCSMSNITYSAPALRQICGSAGREEFENHRAERRSASGKRALDGIVADHGAIPVVGIGRANNAFMEAPKMPDNRTDAANVRCAVAEGQRDPRTPERFIARS